MDPEQAKAVEQAAKELGITQLVPTIYQDLLQPVVRETGQQFVVVAKAVGIALAPLEGAVWGYKQIKDSLSAKVAARLANKPAEAIKSPDKTIAGPLVMNMAFASEAPHLREMYANLLASAMYAPSASRVHPSFVQIIQQLTPAEAQILKDVAARYKSGAVLFREQIAAFEGVQASSLTMRLAASMGGNTTISTAWQSLCGKSGTTDEVLIEAFFRNFVRLGIFDERVESSSGLDPGERLMRKWAGGTKRLWRKVELTAYGNLFLELCVRENGEMTAPVATADGI